MAHAPQIDGSRQGKKKETNVVVKNDIYIYTYNLVLSNKLTLETISYKRYEQTVKGSNEEGFQSANINCFFDDSAPNLHRAICMDF